VKKPIVERVEIDRCEASFIGIISKLGRVNISWRKEKTDVEI